MYHNSPSGQVNCSFGLKYCPLYGACIQNSSDCSFQALAQWRSKNASGPSSCPVGQKWCYGTYSCIANTSTCDYTNALQILIANGSSLCPAGQTFCHSDRQCKVSGANCTAPPALSAFQHLENRTGKWILHCFSHKPSCQMLQILKYGFQAILDLMLIGMPPTHS